MAGHTTIGHSIGGSKAMAVWDGATDGNGMMDMREREGEKEEKGMEEKLQEAMGEAEKAMGVEEAMEEEEAMGEDNA